MRHQSNHTINIHSHACRAKTDAMRCVRSDAMRCDFTHAHAHSSFLQGIHPPSPSSHPTSMVKKELAPVAREYTIQIRKAITGKYLIHFSNLNNTCLNLFTPLFCFFSLSFSLSMHYDHYHTTHYYFLFSFCSFYVLIILLLFLFFFPYTL